MQVAADYWLARGKPVPPKYREKVEWPLHCLHLANDTQACMLVAVHGIMLAWCVAAWVKELCTPPVQVQLMCRYLSSNGRFKGVMEVPDPYYGGSKGFELVRGLHSQAPV